MNASLLESTTCRPMLQCEYGGDRVAIITFDRPSSGANLFDGATLDALDGVLKGLAEREVRGLILRSAKPKIFIAGADIDSVLSNGDPKEVERLIRLGQDVFQALADLPFPTVAAIHGACVGGGYELALACDHRVASDGRATKVGLPETQLGIVPAWGGSTRLPRLIGLPRALDIILGGKTVPAAYGKKLGMVDAVVPKEHLLRVAREMIGEGKAKARPRPLKNYWPITTLVRWVTKRRLWKKTRGCYPALTAALDLVVANLHLSESAALANERRVIKVLANSPEARNLIEVFRLRERAKKTGRGSNAPSKPIRRTTVIGAGVMGAGIAQWSSSRGFDVTLTDVGPEPLAKGMTFVEKLYEQARKRRILSQTEARAGLDRVSPYVGKFPLERCDLVIEAAVERMDIKKAIFQDLETRVGSDTILATNTSALSISELAEATTCPERVIGIHFFNPVHRMPLVEIVRGEATSEETLHRSIAFVQSIGKLPVIVKDSPGFVVNRLLLPYMIEAVKLYESGVDVRMIDEAMLDFGMPMGPMRLIDEVGLDVAAHVAGTLEEAFGDRLAAPKIIQEMIAQGLLGRKTGRGFYDHTKNGKPMDQPRRRDGTSTREAIQECLVALIINEGARCLEEEVVAEPRDIDFAMIMGTGFAPFRGGPLRYADTIGLTNVQRALESAEIEPCGLLLDMAANDRTFYSTET